ncbi:hypothetical protein EUGRSUZ_G00231, partial [Eucalyptus grandis]
MSEAVLHIDKDRRMTERQVEQLAAILHILSLVGSAIAGRISDWMGRRYTISLTGIFFFLGTILMSFFPNNALILLGRAVAQLGVGFAPMIAAIYIAEVSPTSSRGILTSFPEVSINIGTTLGYLISYNASKLHRKFGLLIMLSLGAISPVLLALKVRAMPESPRWLVMQGRLAEAKLVLTKTSDSVEEVDHRLNDMKEAVGIPMDSNDDIVQVSQSTGEGVWLDLLRPTQCVRHMLICTIGVHSLQQACGMDTLLLYAPRMFEKMGITSYNGKLLLIIKFLIVKSFLLLIPTSLLERIGRKQLLLISVGGMSVCLAILGISLTVNDHSDLETKWPVAVGISSMAFCAAFYSIGLGPIPSVYSSEIFPLRLRAQGNAIGISVSQLASAFMAIIFLPMYEAITLGGAAFVLMVITIVSYFFISEIMPETQGKTLEEMSQRF